MKFDTAIALLNEYLGLVADNLEKVAEIKASIAEMEDRREKAIKKNSGEKKPTTASLERPKLAEIIFDAMESGVKYRAGEIYDMHLDKRLTSPSKVTNVLTYMVKEQGTVSNTKEKGVSVYTKVEG